MKVSVIVPVYNGQETILQCVTSALANVYSDFEVIVINDGSTDKTGAILAGINDPRLVVISADTNNGPSQSRNIGMKRSTGELIILLDSDTYVDTDWISRHVSAHNTLGSDIIGGSIVGVSRTMFGACDGFCNWWTSIPGSRDRKITRFHIPSNNISFKKSIFKGVGFFEETMLTGEDIDFCFRARTAGLSMYMKSDIRAYHHDKDTYRGYISHQKKWGPQAVHVRKKLGMDCGFLMPSSSGVSVWYIIPLSVAMTAFILAKWIRYRPDVILYAPIIFMGKFYHAKSIHDTLYAAKT